MSAQHRPPSTTAPTRPPGWHFAWELNPPLKGDPAYADYRALVPEAALAEYIDGLRMT